MKINKSQAFPVPSEAEWIAATQKSLKNQSIEKLYKETYEGIQLKPIYLRHDYEVLTHIDELPGEGSYVRGTSKLGYRQKQWDVAQETIAQTPLEMNEKLKHQLERGQTMIHINLEKSPIVQSVLDFAKVFDNISLTAYPIMIQPGRHPLPILTMFIGYLKQMQIDLEQIQAWIGFDPLAQLVKHGKRTGKLEDTYEAISKAIDYTRKHDAPLRLIHVDCTPYELAGASSTEQLACAMNTATEYVHQLTEKGHSINTIAKQIYFTFPVGSNLFLETAKLRAARMLWSKIIDVFGGDSQAKKMYIHGRTSSWTKTMYDPYVNMLRATTEAFAGVVGGVNSLHVSPYDEAIGVSDEFSERIARNTQTILQEEAHLAKVVDPAGGSWYVETITNQLAAKAWDIFVQIEEHGGMHASLQTHFIQQMIETTANAKKQNVYHRKERIVGTNMYPNLQEQPLMREVQVHSDQLPASFMDCSQEIESCLRGEQALDSLISLAADGATLADWHHALASTLEQETVLPLSPFRKAEPFESLRNHAQKFKEKHGMLPRVLFINLGSLLQHKARADFSASFFGAGGFEAVQTPGFNTADDAIAEVLTSPYSIVVINGSDDQYPKYVREIAQGIKAEKEDITIYVAGKPEPSYLEAGVDDFIHVKANCFAMLRQLQQEKGVSMT